MATKKDLVEAYAFSRRRLVTAFVSGAPGGREVEPTRPGRAIIGGAALAVLLVAGAAVLGILKSPTPVDLGQQGLIIEKETGAHYVILTDDGPLRPVANITSALLLLGPDLTPTSVKRSALVGKEKGAAVGILGAPETPPSPSDLVQTGWTACTGTDYQGSPYGVRVSVHTGRTTTPTSDVGYVVKSQGHLYLVAEAPPDDASASPRAYAYEVPSASPDAILRPLAGSGQTDAVKVTHEWLALFAPGGSLSLSSFGIPQDRYGTRPDDAERLPSGTKVGDLVQVDDQSYLVTPDDAIALDPFAYLVYRGVGFPHGFAPKARSASSPPSGQIRNTRDLPDLHWPTAPVQPNTSGQYCAQLQTGTDRAPAARLVSPGTDLASAVEVPAGETSVQVEAGHGAVVMVGDWDDRGASSATMLDDRGYLYPMVGEAPYRLGYSDVAHVVVPDTWADLFTPGVPLSVDAAACPPTSAPTSARRTEDGSCAT